MYGGNVTKENTQRVISDLFCNNVGCKHPTVGGPQLCFDVIHIILQMDYRAFQIRLHSVYNSRNRDAISAYRASESEFLLVLHVLFFQYSLHVEYRFPIIILICIVIQCWTVIYYLSDIW